MHYIEEKFKTIIVLNGMHAVFRSLPSCWSFLIHFFGTLLPRVSATCPVPPDGQLLEGEQIPLCPKFSKFIGREENFWEGELSNQAKSSYLSKIISAVDRDDLQPNEDQIFLFFSRRSSPPLSHGLLTDDLFNFSWLTILFYFLQAILLLVIEMTATHDWLWFIQNWG